MAEDYRKYHHHYNNNNNKVSPSTSSAAVVLPAVDRQHHQNSNSNTRNESKSPPPTRPSSSTSTGTTKRQHRVNSPTRDDTNDAYFKPAATNSDNNITEQTGDLLLSHQTAGGGGSGRSSFSSTISTTFSNNFYVPISNSKENASTDIISSPVNNNVTATSRKAAESFNSSSSAAAVFRHTVVAGTKTAEQQPPHLILPVNDSAIIDNDDDDEEDSDISLQNNQRIGGYRNPSIITDDGNGNLLLQIIEDNDQNTPTTVSSAHSPAPNTTTASISTSTQTTDSNFDLAALQQLYQFEHTSAAGLSTSASMPSHYPLDKSASLQPAFSSSSSASAAAAARNRLAFQAARAAQFANSKFSRNAISIDVSSGGGGAILNSAPSSAKRDSNAPSTILESPAETQQHKQLLSPSGSVTKIKPPQLLPTHIEINEPVTASFAVAVHQQPSTAGRILGRTKRTHSVAVPSMQRGTGSGGGGTLSANTSKNSSRGNSLRPDEHVPLLIPGGGGSHQHHHHNLHNIHHNPQHRASSFGLGGSVGGGASYFSASNSSSTLRTTPIKITIGGGGGRQRGRDLLKRMESLGGQVINSNNSQLPPTNVTPRTSISGASYGMMDSPNFYSKTATVAVGGGAGGGVAGGSSSGVGTPTGSHTGSFVSRGSRRRRHQSNMLSTSGNNAGSLSGVALDRMSSFRRRPRWAEGIQSAMEGPMGSGPASSFHSPPQQHQPQQHRQQSQSQHHSFDSSNMPHDILLAGPTTIATAVTAATGGQLPYQQQQQPNESSTLRRSFRRTQPHQQQQQSLSRVGSLKRNDSAGGGGGGPMSPTNFEMMMNPSSYEKFAAGSGGSSYPQQNDPNNSRDMEDVFMNEDANELMMMTAAQRWSAVFYENLLMIMTVVSVIAGAGVGFLLRPSFTPANQHQREIMYVRFIGDIFLQLLKMLILPLIVSSLIAGLASLAPATSGKLGIRAILYYFTTTIIAVIIGIVLTTVIQPGSNAAPEQYKADKTKGKNITTVDTFLDLARGMAPPNLVQACLQQVRTDLQPTYFVGDNGQLVLAPKEKWKIRQEWTDGMNLLGLVVFSVAFGITISRLGERGKPLLDFFDSLNEAVMKLVTAVMWLSPLGIFFLVCGKILEVDDFGKMIESLALYTLTVLLGLFIHGAIVLPTIYFLLTRRNPWTFIAGIGQALLTAFGTSSSSATLPVTIACLENNNHIDPRVTRFVLPVGSTINMDGTALYEAVAALFIAQTQAIDLDMGKIIAVSITATAASIGAAGVPQAGLVTMVMVLEAVGLPSEYVSLILAVDWFLDRVRTTINVLGDALGSGIIHYSCQDFLRSMDAKKAADNSGDDGSGGGGGGGGRKTLDSVDDGLEVGANELTTNDELTKVISINNSAKSSSVMGPMTPPMMTDYGAIGHHQPTQSYRQFGTSTPAAAGDQDQQQQQQQTLPNGKGRNPTAAS